MGFTMSAVGREVMRGGTATSDYSDYCSSEEAMSDSESETSASGGFVSSKQHRFQRVDVAGFLKRTYAVDLACDSSLERRQKRAKLDEQLDGLRAVIPDVATMNTERTTTVLDAYHYIATLQRQVQDLNAELLDDESNAAQTTRGHDELYCDVQWSALCQEPGVEVVKRNGVLEVRVVCANRPGLLVDIMKAIECRGFTVVHARIACYNETVVEYLSLEKETVDADSVAGEEERVKTMLLHAICEGGQFDSDLE